MRGAISSMSPCARWPSLSVTKERKTDETGTSLLDELTVQWDKQITWLSL